MPAPRAALLALAALFLLAPAATSANAQPRQSLTPASSSQPNTADETGARQAAPARRDRQFSAQGGRVGRVADEAGPKIEYLTAEQIKRAAPISFTGVNAPFRQAVRQLSRTLRLAIVLDRRLNPDRIVDLKLVDTPLAEALDQLADLGGGGATILGSVAYLGPVGTARRLRTLAALRTAEAQRLPAAARAIFLARRPLSWPALSEPALVFRALADEAHVEIRNLDAVPHDLLAAAETPPLAWVDRMTLVAAQYGLTFRFAAGGRAIELRPIENELLERSYPAGRDAAATLATWRERAPGAELRQSGNKIVVRGTVEDHERIAPAPPERMPGAAALGQQVYTLKMDNVPLDGFLAQLGQQLDMRLELDRDALAAAGIKPESTLSVDVQNATLDELLRAALGPLGLDFRRQGTGIVVAPRANDK